MVKIGEDQSPDKVVLPERRRRVLIWNVLESDIGQLAAEEYRPLELTKQEYLRMRQMAHILEDARGYLVTKLLATTGIAANFDLLVRRTYDHQLEMEQLSTGWERAHDNAQSK